MRGHHHLAHRTGRTRRARSSSYMGAPPLAQNCSRRACNKKDALPAVRRRPRRRHVHTRPLGVRGGTGADGETPARPGLPQTLNHSYPYAAVEAGARLQGRKFCVYVWTHGGARQRGNDGRAKAPPFHEILYKGAKVPPRPVRGSSAHWRRSQSAPWHGGRLCIRVYR